MLTGFYNENAKVINIGLFITVFGGLILCIIIGIVKFPQKLYNSFQRWKNPESASFSTYPKGFVSEDFSREMMKIAVENKELKDENATKTKALKKANETIKKLKSNPQKKSPK